MVGRCRCLAALVTVFLLTGSLPGCGFSVKSDTVSPGSPAVKPPGDLLVAVAPLENRSNYVEAPDAVQLAFVVELMSRGWNVMSPFASNEQLRETMGVSYGGQLKATSPAELCRVLGVDGIFYGEVLGWSWFKTFIYNSHSVEAAFRLYRKDGALAWDGGRNKGKETRLMPTYKQRKPYEPIPEKEIEETKEFLDFLSGRKLRSVEDLVRKFANKLPASALTASPGPSLPEAKEVRNGQ